MQRSMWKIAGRLVLGLGAGAPFVALTARPAEARKPAAPAASEDVTPKVQDDQLAIQVLGQPGRYVQLLAGEAAERGVMKPVEGGSGIIGADGRLDLLVPGRALGGNGLRFVGLQAADDAALRRGVTEIPLVQLEVAAGKVRGPDGQPTLAVGSIRTAPKGSGRLLPLAGGAAAP
ncbi:MAG: hypothetical protein R3F60_02120 [bacterium]